MRAAPVSAPNYDARIRRAELLASRYPFAAEVLTFYRHLAEFQKQVYLHIASERRNPAVLTAGQLRTEPELSRLLPSFPEFLRQVARVAPAPAAQAANALANSPPQRLVDQLRDLWQIGGPRSDSDDAEMSESAAHDRLIEFCLRAFSQPYAEFLGHHTAEPPLAGADRQCPRCGSDPLLGVLHPEGDGAKRRLLCSFCLQEWDFRRIYCAACGEEDEKKLPVYVAEQFPHIRVECCDTCNHYLRTIDLTKDGHAVPIVDDLAALPLSLWAAEHHYSRLHPNLLST